MPQVNFFIAFFAGIISILSPCILPIMPSFLAYISGISLQQNTQKQQSALILYTLCFGLGFSITFLTFGAVIGALGQFLILNQTFLQQIGGLIIILFGLNLLGLLKISSLIKEYRFSTPKADHGNRLIKSFLIGIIFAFGWAPCYGPVLGAIFTLAATSSSFYQSLGLFAAYSLGFLIPLIAISLFIGQASKLIKNHQLILRYNSFISGSLLILLGILMLTDLLSPIVNYLNRLYIDLNIYSL